jgi:hypothetical protein
MRLSLQFPTIVYREGPEALAQIARAAERIGFDQIDFFDHVVMGHPMEGRDPQKLGFQAQITAPFEPDDPVGRGFHSSPERIAAVAASARQAGFGWAAINGIAVHANGARNVDALAEDLERIHERVRVEVGRD